MDFLGLDLDVSWCLCLCHHFFILCCVSSVSVVLVVLHSILKLTSRAQCQRGLCQKKSKSGEILNYWKAMSIRLIDCENLRSSGSTQISSLMQFNVPICNILGFFSLLHSLIVNSAFCKCRCFLCRWPKTISDWKDAKPSSSGLSWMLYYTAASHHLQLCIIDNSCCD